MNEMPARNTVSRLVAIKSEELELYRQDLARLERILQTEQEKLLAAQEGERRLLAEIREAEQGKSRLDPVEMVEGRRYLEYLQEITRTSLAAFERVVAQRDNAHRCVLKAFEEMRVLERLAERRLGRALAEQRRVDFRRADDQEIARITFRGRSHDLR
jgi:flagellar biosynthesis chaperone FliJ